MLPIFSIIISIGLPIFAMSKIEKNGITRCPYMFSVVSFIFCSFAMIQEIYTIKHRLLSNDIGGIEDTIGAVLIICVVLLIVTAILNIFLLAIIFDERNK